jgi:hypothetical protein
MKIRTLVRRACGRSGRGGLACTSTPPRRREPPNASRWGRNGGGILASSSHKRDQARREITVAEATYLLINAVRHKKLLPQSGTRQACTRCGFGAISRVYLPASRGCDLISDALPFGCLWYGEPNAINNAIGYAKSYSRSHDAAICVYDAAGNVIETHEHTGEFKEW